jgi:hypothetical protein
MKPTQLLHEAGQSLQRRIRAELNPALGSVASAFAASWQDLLARVGARHEHLARTA